MQTLSNKLVTMQKFVGEDECTLVINGKIVVKNKSLVYVKYLKQTFGSCVKFYTKKYVDGTNSKKTVIREDIEDPGFISRLLDDTDFFGIRLGKAPKATEENLKVDVDSSLHVIFVETLLYKTVRDLILSGRKNVTIAFNQLNIRYDDVRVRQMIRGFKEASWTNYLETIYINKIINRIYKSYDTAFYGIFHTFIPILIECKYLYNPLVDDPDSTFLTSRMYTELASYNRVFDVIPDGVLRVTLASHLEICKALHMKYMVRMTPQFFYSLVVGVGNMHKPTIEFPNVDTKLYVAPAGTTGYPGIKKWYSEIDMVTITNQLRESIKNSESEDDKKRFADILNFLNSYSATDSLWVAVNAHHSKLVKFGAPAIDSKANCTPLRLYDYLRVATIY